MKALSIGFASLLLLTSGTAAVAKAHPKPKGDVALLQRSLNVVAAGANIPTSQTPKTVDHDQGDDHAKPRAIERVCNMDNPAAIRSAICPLSVSPDCSNIRCLSRGKTEAGRCKACRVADAGSRQSYFAEAMQAS